MATALFPFGPVVRQFLDHLIDSHNYNTKPDDQKQVLKRIQLTLAKRSMPLVRPVHLERTRQYPAITPRMPWAPAGTYSRTNGQHQLIWPVKRRPVKRASTVQLNYLCHDKMHKGI